MGRGNPRRPPTIASTCAETVRIAHGNLVDGIDLPKSTTFLMRRPSTGRQAGPRRVLRGAGTVLATTLTLEFSGQRPAGRGPSLNLRNLFAYALTGSCHGS